MPLFRLIDNPNVFPNPELAPDDGFLAIGGDLSPERLVSAYSLGFFPWFNEGEEIQWYHPNPRMILLPQELKVAKSMRPLFNQQKFRVTYDDAFETVMENCRTVNFRDFNGTWISTDLIEAYTRLHRLGVAHSVEVWNSKNELVGGLYGISLGRVFYGESMFAHEANASKYGFITLVRDLQQWGYWLIDCQQETEHLESLGAKPIHRSDFIALLQRNETQNNQWKG